MKFLAIDTATEACSAALQVDGEVQEFYEIVPRSHAQRILPMVDALLADAGLGLKQLDALVFDRGPGSFTGVRIGASVIQGLAFASELPVIAVSSLAALAQGGLREQGFEKVLAVIDARMGEVYWGFYRHQNGRMCLMNEERVSPVTAIPSHRDDEWLALGSGCQTYVDELSKVSAVKCWRAQEARFPHARDLLTLAVFEWEAKNVLPAEKAEPVYLRDNVAKKQK